MTQFRQDQSRPSDVYDDTFVVGATLETQTDIEGDLNATRSQIKRILGTTNWYDDVPITSGLTGLAGTFLAFHTPFDTTKKFTLGAPAAVVAVTSSMLPALSGDGGSRKIAVGGTSTRIGGYVAASSPGFTAGTPAAGSEATGDANGQLLNLVGITKDADNEVPLDSGEEVFGLLQSATGVADGTAVAAGPGGENLQISFMKITPGTDSLTSVSLPAAVYQFAPIGLTDFATLKRGAFLGTTPLPDVIDPSTAKTFTKSVLKVITADIAADTSIDILSGTANITYASGYDIHPSIASAAEFVKSWFVYRNGQLLEHGSAETTPAGNDVYYATATTIKFNAIIKVGDVITIVGPTV